MKRLIHKVTSEQYKNVCSHWTVRIWMFCVGGCSEKDELERRWNKIRPWAPEGILEMSEPILLSSQEELRGSCSGGMHSRSPASSSTSPRGHMPSHRGAACPVLSTAVQALGFAHTVPLTWNNWEEQALTRLQEQALTLLHTHLSTFLKQPVSRYYCQHQFIAVGAIK